MKNRDRELTQARLTQVLDYNPETGIFIWKVARQSIKAGDIAGYKDKGYIKIGIDGKKYRAHRLAWLFVHGDWPNGGLDHIDQIRDHNWIKNLREYSRSHNAINSKTRIDNTSGIEGVHWRKPMKKWQVYISDLGKLKHLGYYKKLINAVRARDKAEIEHRRNIISSKPLDARLYILRYESNKALREQSTKGLHEQCYKEVIREYNKRRNRL